MAKAGKRSRRRHSRARAAFLVLGDLARMHANEKEIYDLRCRDLEKALNRLRQFEEKDLPAFVRWSDLECFDLIEEAKAVYAEVDQLARLVDSVHYLAQAKRISEVAAFRLLTEAKDERQSQASDEASERPPDPFAAFEAIFEEADEAPVFTPPHQGIVSTAEEYLKTIYRNLVRLLHPDHHQEKTTEQQTKLWHEMQDAYAWKDLQRLERIYKIASSKEADPLNFAAMSLPDRVALRKDVEQRLRETKNKLASARENPAWEFSLKEKNTALLALFRKQMLADLRKDLAAANEERDRLEPFVERWKRGARKQNKHPGKF